jgi:hypothetical protein
LTPTWTPTPYPFAGAHLPWDDLGVPQSAKAGQAVSIRFSLGGDFGLDIFAPGYPKSEQVDCNSIEPVDGVEETRTAGASGLTYDPATGQYTYVWKTDKAWAGTCRQFVIQLVDGSYHRVKFEFK